MKRVVTKDGNIGKVVNYNLEDNMFLVDFGKDDWGDANCLWVEADQIKGEV